MSTTASFSAEAFFQDVKRRALRRALLRPESLVIMALSITMVALCALRVFWFPETWPIWLAFGLAGVSLIAYLSLRDEAFIQEVGADLFYERLDKKKLKLPELQRSVSDALEYHRLLFGEIARRPYAPLGAVAADMDRLVAGVYHLAHSLDQFVTNEQIKDYLLHLLDGRSAAAEEEPLDSIDRYTMALVAISSRRTPTGTPYDESYLLDNVCYVVASARGQLNNTLKSISAVHQRIAAAPAAQSDADWGFVETVRGSLEDHLHSVEERASAVTDLYRDCQSAADQAKQRRQAH